MDSLLAAYPRLVSLLALYTGSLAVGEDLAQDALVRAWERRSELNKVMQQDLWLYKVGLNLARSRYRRKKVELRHRQALEAIIEPSIVDNLAEIMLR